MLLQAVGIARQGGAEGLKLLLPLIQGMLPLQHFLCNTRQFATCRTMGVKKKKKSSQATQCLAFYA